MNVSLMLDQPESVLGEAGFSLVHLCRHAWERLTASNVVYEPISQTVMLEPNLRAQSNRLAEFATTWGEWRESSAPALSDETGLLQCLVSGAATAGADTYAEYPRDQGFVLRFYLYEPPPGFLGMAGVTLFFGGRYSLRVDAEGMGYLGRDPDLEWTNGAEPPLSDYGVHEIVAQGPLLEGGENVFGVWRRIVVLPVKGDRLLVLGARDKGFVWREPDILTATPEVTEDEEPVAYRHLSFRAPARLLGEGGAWAFNLSTPRYPPNGSIASPLIRLPYTAATLPDSAVTFEPRPGLEMSLSLLSEPGGGALEAPCDQFAYALQIVNPEEGPAMVYDVRARFDPTTRLRSPTAVEAGPYLLELRESRSLRDRSARLWALIDNAAGSFTAKADRCNMRAELTVNGVRRFTGLTGPSNLIPGPAPKWELSAEDPFKRLRHAVLSDETAYDGWPHTEAARALLRAAGIPEEAIAIAEDDTALPTAEGDDDPLFQPRNGETVADFLEYLREAFSGWRMFFDRHGVFHYEPDAAGGPPAARFSGVTAPDGSARPILRMSDEIDETGFANEITVIGLSPDGEPIAAVYLDARSQDDPTYEQYVGERRLLIWVDTALSTQAAVNWVCRTLADAATRFRRRVRFEAPFDPALHPGDLIDLDGETLRLLSMDTVLVPRLSRTLYEAEAL